MRELTLIEAAREQKLGWAVIAEALGLKSRQAAEQRYLRLSGAIGRDPQVARQERTHQRSVDRLAGTPLAGLRQAVRKAHREIAAQSTWDESHARAALARRSLEAALPADPGSLFALADKAIGDLEAMGSPLAEPLSEALRAAATAAKG